MVSELGLSRVTESKKHRNRSWGVITLVDLGDFQNKLSKRFQVQWERRNHKASRNGAERAMGSNTRSNNINKLSVS